MNFSEAWQPGKHRAGFCFPPPETPGTTAEGRPRWPGRALAGEPWRGRGCRLRGKPGPARCPLPGVPGRLPLPTSWAPGDAIFRRHRELKAAAGMGARVPAVLASWHGKGERACRAPSKRRASASRAGPGQAQQHDRAREGRAARPPAGPRVAALPPAPAVAQSFPWHCVLLSQQARHGQGLGRAAGWS